MGSPDSLRMCVNHLVRSDKKTKCIRNKLNIKLHDFKLTSIWKLLPDSKYILNEK